jgi:hypothetical protein
MRIAATASSKARKSISERLMRIGRVENIAPNGCDGCQARAQHVAPLGNAEPER